MSIPRYSSKHLLIAAGFGAALGFGISMLMLNPPDQSESAAVKNTLASPKNESVVMQTAMPEMSAQETTEKPLDIEQLRKDLSTRFIGDPRTLGEKLRDFVAENSTTLTIPIACKVVADLAENTDALSNQELDALFHNQTDPELKRVIAQASSLRGDNSLLDQYISELQPGLSSDNPDERRKALQLLAKTHYAGAAGMLAPALRDPDTSVKLDALLALRATGNESHTHHLEKLRNNADPSVSWLANDALSSLQYLSTKARTKIISADIAAELPPLPIAGN